MYLFYYYFLILSQQDPVDNSTQCTEGLSWLNIQFISIINISSNGSHGGCMHEYSVELLRQSS